ncbi:hypothetical protein Taro_011248 [Colocasia esculenta]|uniref:Senescence domain-containing protein n=1 Tax=Colocasia esculenta TaxID=4460 RepID=A0A843U5R7_COLES|nr:hypothetical protein [Colocasia esculenta]
MTEKMSRSLLNGVVTVSGAVTTPVFKSTAGKALLGSVPGVVLLASLDAVNRVLDAVEAAEKKTLDATGQAAGWVVSQGLGESAGEATKDVFATAGHAVGTAWNLFKIRKAFTPSSSLSSSLVKNAVKKRNTT